MKKKKNQKNFYCRLRDCIHHQGFNDGDVICNVANPEITFNNGKKICLSYKIHCNCNHIPQSQECYNQMTVLKIPENITILRNAPDQEKLKYISVDQCLAGEIKNLWSMGIITTGCCCGHNRGEYDPFIGVKDEFIPIMKELGYKVAYNNCRPNDEDSFIPKSKLLKN